MKPVCTCALACAMVSSAAARTDFPEIEPNNSKSQATLVSGMVAGDTLSGFSLAGTDGWRDYFRIRTSTQAPGVYRHRLVITSPISGHIGTIRGLNQIDGVIGDSDFTAQSSAPGTLPPFYNQWYSLGAPSELYYRVTGSQETTQPYTVTLETQQVQAQSLGQYEPGELTITAVNQGHTTDTDLWVADSNLTPLPMFGNDNTLGPAGVVTQSTLTRVYAPGIYYLAMTDTNLANNLASPEDDANRNGVVLDFGGAILNSNAVTGLDLSFAIESSDGTIRRFNSVKSGAYDINWFSFEVVPAPGAGALLGLAGMVAARRRRG